MLSQIQNDDLELLVMIRHFELSLLDLFSQGKLNGTTHTCLGQEYIPVAVSALLTNGDFIFSNHRGHGHYLARFNDPHALLAEIMGREGAVCNGFGGSQHIFQDTYLSTGIQGESMPVAVGVALHLKRARRNNLALVYIGDGSWGAGAVYEALNIAQLWQAPLVVVVENNRIAQSTPTVLQMAGTIEGRVRGFGLQYLKISSLDINRIRDSLAPCLDHVRSASMPCVIEFETYRLGPHSKGDDTRDAAELQKLREMDWYQLYRRQFPAQFEPVDVRIRSEIEAVIRDVESRPLVAMELV